MDNYTNSLYQECMKRGILCRNHESDLYIPVTKETTALLKQYDKSRNPFVNQTEGGLWYEVPFAFDPWWSAKEGRRNG